MQASNRKDENILDKVDTTIANSQVSLIGQQSSRAIENCTENLEEIFYINVRFLQKLKRREKKLPPGERSTQSTLVRIALNQQKIQTKRNTRHREQ